MKNSFLNTDNKNDKQSHREMDDGRKMSSRRISMTSKKTREYSAKSKKLDTSNVKFYWLFTNSFFKIIFYI